MATASPKHLSHNTMDAEDLSCHFLTFWMERDCFAFPLASVLEIIRVPETVQMPLTPPCLMGLANLRGTLLPVVNLRRVLGLADRNTDEATRVVVTELGKPVGLLVDQVSRVLKVEREKIEDAAGVATTVDSDMLVGVVKGVAGHDLVQILDPMDLMAKQFQDLASTGDPSGSGREPIATRLEGSSVVPEDDLDVAQLVSFLVNGQEYAFYIETVEEIVRMPETVSRVPSSREHVLGLVNLRGRLLPLLALRRLLGMGDASIDDHARILVLRLAEYGDTRERVLGVVVDQVREVLQVSAHSLNPVPPVLHQGGDVEEVSGVCRLDEGRRLVFVLDTHAVIGHPSVMAAVRMSEQEQSVTEETSMSGTVERNMEDTQLVVFHLGDEEFGVPVDAVNEITRVPDQMSRVPESLDFVEGMINLRGTVLPVMDMRTRFGMERLERNDRQRIVVLTIDGVKTGFIVDDVSEVLRIPRSVIEKPPHLSEEQARVIRHVANLKDEGRMVLIFDINGFLEDEKRLELADAL